MITEKLKKELKERFYENTKIDTINNKILDYKNKFSISKENLKDFIISDIYLFINRDILEKVYRDDKEILNKISENISFMKCNNIKGIKEDKLISSLKELYQKENTDKVILLKENEKIYQLYIKVIPQNSYNYNNISFVIPLTKERISIIENINNFNKDYTKINGSLLIRAGYYTVISDLEVNNFDSNKNENNSETDKMKIYLLNGIDIVYLQINNIMLEENNS